MRGSSAVRKVKVCTRSVPVSRRANLPAVLNAVAALCFMCAWRSEAWCGVVWRVRGVSGPALGVRSTLQALYERLTSDPKVFGNPEVCIVYPLHSTLSTEEQKAVFIRPPVGVRKIVISTNVRACVRARGR
jgi:hypothetical protein